MTDEVRAGARDRRVSRDDDPATAAIRRRSQRRLAALLVATALCYAIGYPTALVGHSAAGWIFVALGGPLLVALGVVVIRRVHLSVEADRRAESDAT